MNLCALRFEGDAWWQVVCEGADVLDDSFGLAPGGTHDADSTLWMCGCVPEKKCCDDVGFSALSAPTGGNKLVVLEHLDKFFLVCVWFEAYDLFKKSKRIPAYLLGFLN